jgi:hypothetical protein
VRFCLSCEKNVYNLSAMTRDAAEELLRERLGNDLCIRFYQRADGTILTQDCPTGVKKKRRKKLALAVAGAGAMAAAAATAFMSRSTCDGSSKMAEMTGAVAGGAMYPGDPVTPVTPDVKEVKGDTGKTPWVTGSAPPPVARPPAPPTIKHPMMGKPSTGRR